MVESLKELNKKCQKPRYKEVGNWFVRNFIRDAALPVTWLLLHTSVTANQVTLASLFIAFAGIILIALPTAKSFLIGTLLLQFWYYLDHVDGQIARYRGTSSMSGRFFDFLMHHMVESSVYFSLGFYMYNTTLQISWVILGFIAALSMWVFRLTNDTKYKTFFEKLLQSKKIEMNAVNAKSSGKEKTKRPSMAKSIFSFIHKLNEMHVLMNILTAAAILDLLFDDVPLRPVLFLIYGITAPVLAVTKTTFLITHKEIDREFQHLFKVS